MAWFKRVHLLFQLWKPLFAFECSFFYFFLEWVTQWFLIKKPWKASRWQCCRLRLRLPYKCVCWSDAHQRRLFIWSRGAGAFHLIGWKIQIAAVYNSGFILPEDSSCNTSPFFEIPNELLIIIRISRENCLRYIPPPRLRLFDELRLENHKVFLFNFFKIEDLLPLK